MRKYTVFLVVLYLLFLLTSCAANEADNITISTLTVNKDQSTENGSEQFAESTLNSGEEKTANTSNVFPSQAETSTLPNVNFDTPVSAVTDSTTGSFSVPEIESSHQSYALYCVDDEQFIYKENSDVPVAPASLTKLLTASVALHYIKADEVFSVGSEQNLVKPESSLCLILEGHRLKLYDLISGMLMVSGNDAAYTVAVCTARIVSGDSAMNDNEAVDYFCGLMNDFAKKLGMHQSHFVTPDGWDNAEQYTTAYDLALLAKYALSVPEIREITSTYQKYVVFESGENITWTNSNRLLDPDSNFYHECAIGLKTGTTEYAGCCLIAAFVKDEKTFVSVVTGCNTDFDRYVITIDRFSFYT